VTDFETVIYEKVDWTALITLNRPEVLNRYNVKMRDELYEILHAVKDDPDIMVVIFRGAGERAFCVGADLSEFGTAPSPLIARQVRWERDVWGTLARLQQPVIAALHGYVLGSGVEIALLCDIRIASEDALFGLPEVSLGMIPAAGGSQTLPRTIGNARALNLLLTCDRIDATEALRVGLVNRVVKREELYTVTEMLAQKIKSQSTIAVKYAKDSLRRGLDMGLQEGLLLERRLAESLRIVRDSGPLTNREDFS